jgi:Cytochrome oxidase complex assembly protein 1
MPKPTPKPASFRGMPFILALVFVAAVVGVSAYFQQQVRSGEAYTLVLDSLRRSPDAMQALGAGIRETSWFIRSDYQRSDTGETTLIVFDAAGSKAKRSVTGVLFQPYVGARLTIMRLTIE